MAANKKNAKGNKTAHVLNLLTAPGAPREGAPAGEETSPAEAATEPSTSAPSRPLLPPILEVAQANDDNLSQQIQRALEEELEEEPAAQPAAQQPTQSTIEEVPPVASELPITQQPPASPATSAGKMSQDEIEKLLAAANAPADEPAPAPVPEPPAPSAPSGGKMSQEEIEKLLAAANAPAEEPAPAPEPPAPSASSGGKMNQEEIEKLLAAANAPVDKPAPVNESVAPPNPAPHPPEEEDVCLTKNKEGLVVEKAPGYMKKFGLCTCKQCLADVKALTLTNLVPKYVVLSKLDRIPMLTVYEGRFNSTIFAQLTRACKTVMDHPHHNRKED